MKTRRLVAGIFGAAITVLAQFPDFTPPSPLFAAVLSNNTVEAKRLLAAGADPNEVRFIGSTVIFFALKHGNSELVRALIEKGADVKATDAAGSTTLMWAATDETANPEMVGELLRLGVDPNVKNKKGETALDWALQRGHTPVVEILKKHGGSEAASIKQSIEKAVSLLQKSGAESYKVTGCASCHNHSLPQMANALVRERGLALDEALSQQQVKAVVGMYKPVRESMAAGKQNIPDAAVTVSYALIGLAAEGYPADAVTDAMAHVITTYQNADGSFMVLPARPPIESSVFSATALSLRAMQLYGKNAEDRILRALNWLRSAKPITNEDRTMQLLGLAWAKASSDDLQKFGRSLLAEQRPDGGWGQLTTLESDAYATGQALVALHSAGQLSAMDPAYQRGVGFLTRTQFADGSWLVRTRSIPFQAMKETGFPHGKHQWISAAGSSWAAMALSLTQPVAAEKLTRVF